MIFYYIAWLGWIYATFMMKKERNRTFLAAFILLLITFSNTYISFLHLSIYLNGILLCIVGIYLIAASESSKCISMLYSTIIGMVYCIYYFIELYDPYWIVIPRVYLLSVILCLSCFILVFNIKRRIGIFLVGTFQGECMLGVSLYEFGFHNDIASMDYLAVISVSLVVFISMYGIRKLLVYAETGKQKQMKGMKGL